MRKFWLIFPGILFVFMQCEKEKITEENDGASFEHVTGLFPGRQQINALAVDPSGDKWIGTDSGLFKFDNKKWLAFSPLKHVRINSLISIDDALYLASSKGAYSLKIESGNTVMVDSFNQSQTGASFNEVNAFDIGLGKRHWFGIPAGLAMFNGVKFLQNKSIALSLVSVSDVNSIAFRYNDAFFGTNGRFVFRVKYNPETDAITGASQLLGGADNPLLNYNGELTTDTIFCVMASADSSIWFGSLKGLTRNKGGTKVGDGLFEYHLHNERVRCVYEFSDGAILAGTENGLFIRKDNNWTGYTVEDGLPGNLVFCMAEDKDGSIWIGTDKGICNFQKNGFTNY